MHKATALDVVILMLLLTYGDVSYAQNMASQAAPLPLQPASAASANMQSTPQQQYVMPQAGPNPQSTNQLPRGAEPYLPLPNTNAAHASSPTNAPLQAKVWQPDFTQIKSPDDIRAAMAQRRQKFEAALNSWIGTDINGLIMTWGAPNGVYKMPNQNIIYTWQNTGGMPAPDGGEIIIFCKISIFTDPHGRIFNWQAQGNDCV